MPNELDKYKTIKKFFDTGNIEEPKEPNMSVGEPANPYEVSPMEQSPDMAANHNEILDPNKPDVTEESVYDKMEKKLSEAERLKSMLEEARRKQSLQRGLADLMAAGKKYSAAQIGGGGVVINPDTSMADRMRTYANDDYKQDISDLVTKREIEKEEVAKRRDEQIAETYKTILKSKLGKEYKDVNFDNMRASEIIKAGQMISQLGKSPSEVDEYLKQARAKYYEEGAKQRSVSAELAPEKFEYRKKEKFEDDARSAIKDMRATQSWKDAEKSVSEVPVIRNLLADAYEKGGQSLSMIGPKVAKGIAGEVGVLTEQDVTRYVQDPTILGGLRDTMKKVSVGRLSEVSYENLNRLLNIAEKTAKDKMEKALDRESKLFSKREKLDYGEARALLDENIGGDNRAKLDRELSPKDKQALEWANANPNDPRAIKIKAKLGM